MAQKTVFHTDIYIEKELEQETSGDIQILAKRTTDNKTVWVEAGGGGGIESVSGDSVDNTDPLNPVINAIPLTGTTEGNPVTGDVEFEEGYSSLGFIKKTTDENFYGRFQMSDTGAEIFVSDIGTSNNLVSLVVSKENQRVQISSTNPLSSGLSGIEDFTSNITALDYVQKKYVDDALSASIIIDSTPTDGSTNAVSSNGVFDALGLKVNTSAVGSANGVSSLDSNGKVPLTQINDALLGNVSYQGLYNASTNTPNITTVIPKGHYYIVSTAGTQFGISFEIGDWIISDGASYSKVDNTDAVSSVAGKTGVVVLAIADITGLQSALDGKGTLSGGNTWSDAQTFNSSLMLVNGGSLQNSATSARGKLSIGSASESMELSRNLADALAAARTLNQHASSTGNIHNFDSNVGGTIATRSGIRKDGRVFGANGSENNDFVTVSQLGVLTAYVSKTASYTIADTDMVVDLTANTATFTLPTAVGKAGKRFTVKNSGTGVLTVNTTSSQTIDGMTTMSFNTQYSGMTVVSDGTNWKIISNF